MKHSRTHFVLLGLLASFPDPAGFSGYDLRKGIEGSVGHFWGESYGQIYPALKRLATDGFIQEVATASTGKRASQRYIITPSGHQILNEWLAAPFQNDPPRNEFLLKLFFGQIAGPAISLKHVERCQQKNTETLRQLAEMEQLANRQGNANPHQLHWRLTLDLGLALTRAALDWGEKAMRQLEAAANSQPTDS